MAYDKKFVVGLIQMACTNDPDENLRTAVSFVEDAARAGAQVVCLPELFRSKYFCQNEDTAAFDLAESVPGPSTTALSVLARQFKIAIVASVFERRAPGIYHNTVAVIDADGEIVGIYRKMHIPDDPAFYEKFYFTPGDLGFCAFDTRFGRIGSLICWDQWFPEAARLVALHGAMLLFYPTAIAWHPDEKERYGLTQRDAWRTAQQSNAIANGIYVAAVNRIGFETAPGRAGLEFWGSSFICGPTGEIIAEASQDKEEVVLAEVDVAVVEQTRRVWPFLRDRRTDAYRNIGSRFIQP